MKPQSCPPKVIGRQGNRKGLKEKTSTDLRKFPIKMHRSILLTLQSVTKNV